MKKVLLLLMLVVSAGYGMAQNENIIQMKPCVTQAGIDGEEYENVLEIEMTNTFDVANLQFDLLLPEGVTYVDYDFQLFDGDFRVPNKRKGKNYTFYFSVSSAVLSNGYRRFMFIPQANDDGQLEKIEAGTGVFMQIYYSTDANMANGVYPVLMDNITLVKSVSEGSIVTSTSSSSYIVIGETALDSKADIDLSGMTGYVPSFVVEQLNTDMAANGNLRTVNLSGATELGAELSVPENVVYAVGTKGGLKRNFAAQKSTVCLPFALNAEQVSTIKAKGCDIEQLASFDAETNTVSFAEVDEMEANVPYLITCNNAGDMFDGIENFSFGALTAPADITKGDLTMKGAFEKTTIDAKAGDYTYYAYKAADGKFVKVGTTATVNPFRAYLAKKGSNGARYLNIAGDDATAIHGIQEVEATGQEGTLYNLQGLKASGTQKGLYIKDGKKYVVN